MDLEFHEKWEGVCLMDLSHPSSRAIAEGWAMKNNPNAKFIGKEVMVVGANHYKATKGIIRDTTPLGEATVELYLFNHPRKEKFQLDDLCLL